MGNAIIYESQGAGDPSKDGKMNWRITNSRIRARHVDSYPKGLQNTKPFPFLAEPVMSKFTERGEATLPVSACENTEHDELEDHEDDASNKVKLRYAVSEMQGWRSHMEDNYLLDPRLSTSKQQEQLLKDHHLFAVFDGHRGDYASHFCREHFVSTLITQNDWKTYLKLPSKVSIKSCCPTRGSVIGLQLLKSALTTTFLELDVKLMEAQRELRFSQLSHLEDLVFSLFGNVEYDLFQPGTEDHDSLMNFSKQLPEFYAPLECSGSTGVVVLITPSHILCANAGDSRAILSKKSQESSSILPLSFDHKPNKDVELCRVEKDGGFVTTNRVDGGLAVSRGFGDFDYKNCARDDNNSKTVSLSSGATKAEISLPKDHRVTVNPDIIVHTREPSDDEFVVLACDGIWDHMSNRDCAALVRDLAYGDGESDVGLICEEVIDTAFELDSHDNMTCCVVFFPTDEHGSPNIDGGVLKRHIDRRGPWGKDSIPVKRAQLRKVPRSQVCGQKQQRRVGHERAKTWSPSERSCSGLSVESSPDKSKKHKAPNSPVPDASKNISSRRSCNSSQVDANASEMEDIGVFVV